MSLTKATYAMISGAPVNVLDYGAVGDNVADDTSALQAAINASDYIYIPNGIYKITAPLNVPSNKVIIGSGNNRLGGMNNTPLNCVIHKVTNTVDSQGLDAILACHDDVVSPVYPPQLQIQNVKISGLTLVGNNVASDLAGGPGGATDNNQYGIFYGAGEGLILENITIINCADAVHIQRAWLSRLSSVLTFGRIYQSGGTSTVYTACQAGFNNSAGFELKNVAYSTLISCSSDNGAYGRYVFEACRGLTLDSCALENINENLGSGYIYTGEGMYIQFKGNCSAVVNGFRAFDQVTNVSQAPTSDIYYISATTNDKITFISDHIDRQLPAYSPDYAFKIFNLNDNAEINIVNPHGYLGANFFRSQSVYTGGATLKQIQSTDSESFTPKFKLGATEAVSYAEQNGKLSIYNNTIYLTIFLYVISKNGTGNAVISNLPTGLVSVSQRVPVQIGGFSGGAFVGEGILTSAGELELYIATSGSPITDANVPATPFCTMWAQIALDVGM